MADRPIDEKERVVPFGFLGVSLSSTELFTVNLTKNTPFTRADQPFNQIPKAYYLELEREMDIMVRNGVESLRIPVNWQQIQPYDSTNKLLPQQLFNSVDTDGVPSFFSKLDVAIGLAAERGIQVLPVITGTPRWAAIQPYRTGSPPRNRNEFARFVVTLVNRYGKNGKFWQINYDLPKTPVLQWQIWNEPNHSFHWTKQPFAKEYVSMLKATYTAVKATDKSAQIVLAPLTNFSWQELDRVYAAGAKPWFDVASVNAFTAKVKNLLGIVIRNRQVMAKYGDLKKPIMLTEFSWTSADHRELVKRLGWETDEPGQADKLSRAVATLVDLREPLNLQRMFWFNWLSPEEGSRITFNYAGLRKRTENGGSVDKPALEAFRDSAIQIESCFKAQVATRCEQ